MSKIPVVTAPARTAEPQAGTLGILEPQSMITELDTDQLKASLAGLSSQIGEVLSDIRAVGDFRLKEVKVSVEISAEGGVALIGSAKAGAKGAIELTFAV
jgi:hypothetical protein